MSLRPSERAEVRRNKYKVAVDAEEGRRRREDNMVEIRKNKREENLLKKRREGIQAQAFPSSIHASSAENRVNFFLLQSTSFLGFSIRRSLGLTWNPRVRGLSLGFMIILFYVSLC